MATTLTNMALYRLLVRHGADEAEAEQAAHYPSQEDLATRTDVAELKLALLELKADLLRHTTQTLVWLTAIYAGLVTMILAAFRWLQ